jgi:phage terminase large subunit
MKLSDCQQQVAKDTTRFKTVVAGRRTGKTTLAIRELCYHAREPEKVCWYVAPSYRQAKQIAWVKLKKIITDLRWNKRINEAELTITLKNNSRICLRGADNPDSLRGVGIDFLVLDECADIDEHSWTEVLRPTLSDTKGKALFCGTPKGMNWFHTLYNRGLDDAEKEWNSYLFTTLQGGWVDQQEIDQARQDLDAKTFRQEYEATWETYSGIVYYGFDMKDSVRSFQIPEEQNVYHIGIDFNLDPMSAVVSFIHQGIVFVFDEITIWSSNTDELVEEIHNRYKLKKIFAYPDPASRQRKTSAGGRTDLSILQNAGFITKVPGRHMPIRDRINSVNSKFLNAAGHRGIIIHPKCKNLLNSVSKQVYKEGTNLPDKTQGFDHMNDALGYLVSFLFPITRDYTTSEPEFFKMKTGVIGGRI